MSSTTRSFCTHCGQMIQEAGAASCSRCSSIQLVKKELLRREARPRCIWCDSDDVLPIAYGYPSDHSRKGLRELDAVSGGCMVGGFSEAWCCMKCLRRWGRIKREETHFCSSCGARSETSPCVICMSELNLEFEKAFDDLWRSLEEDARRRRARLTVLGVVLALKPWRASAPGPA